MVNPSVQCPFIQLGESILGEKRKIGAMVLVKKKAMQQQDLKPGPIDPKFKVSRPSIIGTTYLAYWTVYSASHSVAPLAGQEAGLEAGLDGTVQEGAQWELL